MDTLPVDVDEAQYRTLFSATYDVLVREKAIYFACTRVRHLVIRTAWVRIDDGPMAAFTDILRLSDRHRGGYGDVWVHDYDDDGPLTPGGLAEAHNAVVARVLRGQLP